MTGPPLRDDAGSCGSQPRRVTAGSRSGPSPAPLARAGTSGPTCSSTRRSRVRAVPVCLALLMLMAACLPAAAEGRESQYTMFEAPTELLSDDAALRARTFDEIRSFGVRRLRVVLYWHSVAPVADDPGVPRFDETDPSAYPGFARYDRLVAEARARGMRVLLTASAPVPRWATRDRDDTVTRPSATRFGPFMRAVIRRYGDAVDDWSIWNEPNHPDFLRPQYSRSRRPVSPGIYRQLVFAADRAFRAVGDRADRMLVGETAPRGTRKVVGPLTGACGRSRSTSCATTASARAPTASAASRAVCAPLGVRRSRRTTASGCRWSRCAGGLARRCGGSCGRPARAPRSSSSTAIAARRAGAA